MAGSGGLEKLPPNKCNRVQQEQIWKDYVHHEERAVKIWRNTWGFLCDEYKKMADDIKEKQLAIQEEMEEEDERDESEGEESEGEESEGEGEEGSSEDEQEIEPEKTLKLPPIYSNTQKVSKVPFFVPPPSTFPPLKTSQEIGWRSARPECRLERFGNWGRPKKSILKHFNWSIYACP